MAKRQRSGSTRRYGARYGSKVRHKVEDIENLRRSSDQKCPYCIAPKPKRLALGIWQCRKCDAKFSARAYSVLKAKEVSASDNQQRMSIEAAEAVDEE
ncbi:MAG: 50S ribosomal protein L37ae [archaeon]